MEAFLGWYKFFVIVDVEIEIILGKNFDTTVLISYTAWSTKDYRAISRISIIKASRKITGSSIWISWLGLVRSAIEVVFE